MAVGNQTLTIADGATRSQALDLTAKYGRRRRLINIFAPGTVSQTVTVYLAPDYVADATDASYVPLQSGGSNVTIPAAKVTQIDTGGAGGLVLVAAAGVTPITIFTLRSVSIK